LDTFVRRHIGSGRQEDETAMLKTLGVGSLEELTQRTVPADILFKGDLQLGGERGEQELLAELKQIMQKNERLRSMLGMGYYGTITPNVILRNLIENPAWYAIVFPNPRCANTRLDQFGFCARAGAVFVSFRCTDRAVCFI
jgi:glycine dehydrogenase